MGYKMKVSTSSTKEVVLGLGKAMNDQNYEAARRYVSDDMKYVDPFGSRDGAEVYLNELEHLRLKFDIQEISLTTKTYACCTTALSRGLRDLPVAGFRLRLVQ